LSLDIAFTYMISAGVAVAAGMAYIAIREHSRRYLLLEPRGTVGPGGAASGTNC
jgi:hypothetical protein